MQLFKFDLDTASDVFAWECYEKILDVVQLFQKLHHGDEDLTGCVSCPSLVLNNVICSSFSQPDETNVGLFLFFLR